MITLHIAPMSTCARVITVSLAPTCGSNCAGQTTDKSDVYAFGVVVLEMMTGMQAVDARRPQGCEALPQLLHPALQAVQLMQVSFPPFLAGSPTATGIVQCVAP